MNRRRFLRRLASGAFQNVRFDDAVDLLIGLGFEAVRVSGSHHIYARGDVPELINLQNVRGEAKPYQLRQLMRLVERYNLILEAD